LLRDTETNYWIETNKKKTEHLDVEIEILKCGGEDIGNGMDNK
jgi:hypothetical protein